MEETRARQWIFDRHDGITVRLSDTPDDSRHYGHSIKWMCVACGREYAVMHAIHDSRISPYSFIHGLCLRCPGNRFSLPGSLECLTLAGWPEVPLPILQYQLDCELRFLDHPHHPHNMEYSS